MNEIASWGERTAESLHKLGRYTMETRRTFITAAALMAAAAPLTSAEAQPSSQDAKTADFLFVQTASGMTFDKSTNRLTLDGVSPITVFFSDRPQRTASFRMRPTRMFP
jgi:hypothetical protein